MSASPMARQATESKSIPTRRILINDASELPSHYSSTPGGTLYSTTPGGTKIVYEKSMLLNLRNSPISKTPPKFDLPQGVMKGCSPPKRSLFKNNIPTAARNSPKKDDLVDHQFDIEI